jgi:acyl carrier protein
MRTKEEVEERFIGMVNKFLKLNLPCPLPPELSLLEVKSYNEQLNPKPEGKLSDAIPLDSIDVLELVIQLEEVFGVVVDDKDIKKLLVWKDLIQYITENQKQ